MKKSENNENNISSNDYSHDPHDVFDLINKYGTYNIQPTSSTENEFPKIAQGNPKTENIDKRNLDKKNGAT